MTVLRIADLGVRLTGADSVQMAMSIPGMAVFVHPEAAVDIDLRLDQPISFPECQWVSEFDIADGESHCRVGFDADGVNYYLFGQHSLLRYDERQPDVVALSTMEHPAYLRFALWVAYSLPALRRGRVPVHSSVVVNGGRAVLCLGESGTGKSTHTRLWLKHIQGSHLLNDDSPVVGLRKGVPTAFGSPWSGKTHCYLDEHYPIAAFLRLEQRPENSIRRLTTIESFTALQPSCPPTFAKNEHTLDLLCSFISDIISRAPAFRLGCLPDEAAARLSSSTILGTP